MALHGAEWPVGDGVTAEWHDCILSFTGSGKIKDFASAAELPWAGFTVTNMTFASGVTPGKNTFAGLADTAMVNGTVSISLLRASVGDFLVDSLAPAEASANLCNQMHGIRTALNLWYNVWVGNSGRYWR